LVSSWRRESCRGGDRRGTGWAGSGASAAGWPMAAVRAEGVRGIRVHCERRGPDGLEGRSKRCFGGRRSDAGGAPRLACDRAVVGLVASAAGAVSLRRRVALAIAVAITVAGTAVALAATSGGPSASGGQIG